MRVVLRTDAAEHIGSGHVMRCLTLADALRKKAGAQCVFVCKAHKGHLEKLITARGYQVRLLPAQGGNFAPTDDDVPHAAWLGSTQAQDAQETLVALAGDTQADWLIVDHYALDKRWERQLRTKAKKIMIIDDLADRDHDCDLLLDQNYFADMANRYKDRVPQSARVCLGPDYALLRPVYAQMHNIVLPRRGPVLRILLYFGGSDTFGLTERVLDILSTQPYRHIGVDVVAGATNPRFAAIKDKASNRTLTEFHSNKPHLADVMLAADLSIGAGGVTTWERCALGLPSIVVTVAANQKPFNDALAKQGIVTVLGEANTLTDAAISNALNQFIKSPEKLAQQATKAHNLVDGKGALRLLSVLGLTKSTTNIPAGRLCLKKATVDDIRDIWLWRNDPHTCKMSLSSAPVAWEEHENWCKKALGDYKKLILIGYVHNEKIGVCRFDTDKNFATVNLNLNPEWRGKKLAKPFLKMCIETYRQLYSQPVHAEIKDGNGPSLHCFKSCGFYLINQKDGIQTYCFKGDNS